MKPRRWYSSPELNPHPVPPVVRSIPARIHLAYAARAWREQGPIIKQASLAAPPSSRQTAARRGLRRIEAA
jgi:hypothetical protein